MLRRVFFVALVLPALVGCRNRNVHSGQQEQPKEPDRRIEVAQRLFEGYYYNEAIDTLKAAFEDADSAGRSVISDAIREIEAAQASLVEYTGQMHHIFFHSLIIYPELAFGSKMAQGYNMWMATVGEFERMLPELYRRGYVLYSLGDLIEPVSGGGIRLKPIMLPQGKIPLILSIDDVSYYKYMAGDGFASRLIVGDDDRVYTEVVTPVGDTVVTRTGDVMPILDDFVAAHPDFSWRGAKGVIALTGYEGALGYRILPKNSEEENARNIIEARRVADALKREGWLFASHSYSHNQFFRTGAITLEQLALDTEKWRRYIEPVTGKTNIFISPFGVYFGRNDLRHRYLVGQGFNIYCPVGASQRVFFCADNIVMMRLNIDGWSLTSRRDDLRAQYFDPDEILDSARPEIK